MTSTDTVTPTVRPDDGEHSDATDAEKGASKDAPEKERAREIGGRKGPDPVRYGDWEKAGRCIDF